MTLRFASRTIPETFMWVRRLALMTLSEEQVLLDIEWSKEASGRQKVTRSRLIHVFDTDPDSQSTSWMTSPLERARFWNLSTLKSIRERFPAPHLPYRSRTPFNREVTFTPSRKRSVVPSNSTCSTKAQVRTTNSTVCYQYPGTLGDSHVHNTAQTLDQGIPALTSAFAARFKSIFPIPLSNQTTEEFSQAITSNLLGGIGYFYGSSIEDSGFSYEWDEEDGETEDEKPRGPRLTEPRGLLTATPSRSFFPRGFYWYVSRVNRTIRCSSCTGTKGSTCYRSELGTMPLDWKSSRIGSTSLMKMVGWDASKS